MSGLLAGVLGLMMATAGWSRSAQLHPLSADYLHRGPPATEPFELARFAPSARARAAEARFEGRLRVVDETQGTRFRAIHDGLGLIGDATPYRRHLPPFDFEFVSTDRHLVPAERGTIAGEHPMWEFILEPGPLWREPDEPGYSRAAIPFSIQERNANCIHHGVLSFRFTGAGEVSKLAFQISSETCQYLKFDMWGLLDAIYRPAPVKGATRIRSGFAAESAGHLPRKPIAELAGDYPGAVPANFGAEIDPADMTAFGFVIDGKHYAGGCATRHGPYPYCEALALPSYSVAKSVFGGIALMRAEKLYPGASRTLISDRVNACRDNPAWAGVTIGNALDMATGNYDSAVVQADENAAVVSRFFLAEDHASKVQAACDAYPRKSLPGTQWVYHTSDFYLAGAALSAFLKSERGPDADIFRDLVAEPIFAPLGLSPLTRKTRRTYDAARQPFFGWGLSFQPGDVARLAQFLGPDHGRIDGKPVLDQALFDATVRPGPGGSGLRADIDGMYYKNGFRTLDVSRYLGFPEPVWVPVMSGFGGIIVALFPNDTAYYYFSDGGIHRWLEAAREAHRIRSFCPEGAIEHE